MNKTTQWVIGLIISVQMAVNGYVIYKLDDLTVKVARVETKLDMHQTALLDPPALTNCVSKVKISTHQTDP